MRSSRVLLALAAILLAAGSLLLLGSESPDEFGWFAYAPNDGLSFLDDATFLVLTPGVVAGATAVWVATLLLAGVVGHRLARRDGARG
ncbi:hypothetical protein [Aeromicrobium sp. 50.2.37]|uniref:hypothetical protein n=1 Tax=Aeromicrobium sp. 50.2.37 TaxID=2969305 RepID=UPI00214FE803|nr:hypothetical protein [Aeromicrobium sp. 50.2.37]MCR4511873.1 hypothetical protein [Aeromicrobium sp. 50.2.37]